MAENYVIIDADSADGRATDPGKHFKVIVPTESGDVTRHYVDMLSLGEELQRKVAMSVRSDKRKATTLARKEARSKLVRPDGLRIGYAFWGFLGDHKVGPDGERLSTPDGNATYSWSIVHEARRRGHAVLPMMPDRDEPGVKEFGSRNFSAFAGPLRMDAYRHLRECRYVLDSARGFPELDVLLLEWRFPIPGRNTGIPRDHRDYQPDLDRQRELLEHYAGSDTRIIVWDLDYKLTHEDEVWLEDIGVSCVFETSLAPRSVVLPRIGIEPPTVTDLLMEHPTDGRASTLLAYIGSRYERDDVLDEWIRPIANRDAARGLVHFYGNWTKELREVQARWPGVVFHDRITTSDFLKVYRGAAGVPLLAKREYMGRGFITPRVWEALQFGSVPIGLQGHTGVSRYTPVVAEDADHLLQLSREIMAMSPKTRDDLRRECVDMIGHMDVRHFVDRLERAL